jgi:SAM-dependent methyltransferase
VAEISGSFTFREELALDRRIDRAAAVLVDPDLGRRLRSSGLRIPVLEHDVAEPVLTGVTADFDPSAVPVLHDGRLVAGDARRRFTETNPPNRQRWAGPIEAIIAGLEGAHTDYATAHARRFAQTMALVPEPLPGATALELSSFPVMTRILTDLGYWCAATVRDDTPAVARNSNPFDASFGRQIELVVDIETESLACDGDLFDLVLACEIIEHLPRDPMQLLVESNRVLRTGGQLILTTPNIVGEHAIGLALAGDHPANYYFFERSGSLDRHHFEWTPRLLGRAIRSAGFAVDHLETYFSWWDSDPAVEAVLDRSGHDRSIRGDNIIAVATKVSPLVERTPDDLYVGDGVHWDTSFRALPRIR